MSEQIISGLVPPRVDSPLHARGARQERRPLSVPSIRTEPEPPATLYGIGHVDRAGRVSARPILRALDWPPRQPIAVQATSTALVIYPDPTGVHRLPATASIALPSRARRCCGIRAGDAVLLAADPGNNVLLVDTLTALDAALASRHAAARAELTTKATP
ncbi:hypothetical protein [Saccharopolyspora mangrovi]|uniref:AbrB/MazE/SpoVT family DNA-binding domain-containing protein n=1 Tax=Saccharopolyspora mangrovi TaxID=3082379 RepID=A0ABU6AIQ0_9PSEU|nr:hypothetical protein [Saccharopolyspora sp. S2-29]MEB3371264.1 hypothetical protein [Saccharopolyspora sp. S2-29]